VIELEPLLLSRLPARNVLEEEPVDVVPGQEDIPDDALEVILLEVHRFGANERAVDHIEADRVCAVLVNHLDGVWVVF